MSGADIVKGSERVSSLGAHRFILFGVLHPPHQRFGVLFAFGVHFFKAGAVLGQGGHSLGAVRGDDADKALSLQLPRPLDSRVVPPCPAAQPLGCSGVMRLQQVCQMLVPGITTHQPDGLGQDESHPVAAVGKGPFQRDGVGQATIKIRHAVDDAGLVDDRDAAGRHEDAVVVRVEVCLGEILRLAVLCISGHHAELCRAAGKRRVIQRILAACIAEGAVDIAQIANKISTLDFFENLRCLRFFSERLLYQKAVQNKAICIPESKSQPLGLQAGTLVIAAEILEIAETTDEIALIIAVVVATSEQGLI